MFRMKFRPWRVDRELTPENLPEPGTLFGDYQEFRVWRGIIGEKESYYVTTQRTYDTE
jgi:hypothetical protein